MIHDQIQNVSLITDVFGKFPSFHDAEILEIKLIRQNEDKSGPALEALIKTWTTTSQVKSDGKLVQKNKSLIGLKFTDILGLELVGFNQQNVILGLYIKSTSDADFAEVIEDENKINLLKKSSVNEHKFYVKFEYCFGVEADFLCRDIIVESVTRLEQ